MKSFQRVSRSFFKEFLTTSLELILFRGQISRKVTGRVPGGISERMPKEILEKNPGMYIGSKTLKNF